MHFKIVCDVCGEVLDVVSKIDDDDIVNYTVNPCSVCLEDRYNEGYEDGYDSGQIDGFSEGCDNVDNMDYIDD